ncbi:uncharacterized protein LOC135220471 [Macrobrachium nipponense]|uniref:uncharacterized protein LOC135220471 n=1 Tax=Macrobrachium nipponense TaxID=159736 RepID=UPI0030C7A258
MLNTNNLNIDDMRGQGYDGAANISGIYNGLQSRLQRQNPRRSMFTAMPHNQNLVLVESAKSSTQFVTFFSLVEKLYAFIANSSKRHAAFMEIQKAMYPEDRPLELKKLSEHKMGLQRNCGWSATKFERIRNDEKFLEIITNVKERAESMAINLPSGIPGQGRRRKMPERYKYSATSATEDQEYQSLDEYYRVRVFYVFLDTILQELQRKNLKVETTQHGYPKCLSLYDSPR